MGTIFDVSNMTRGGQDSNYTPSLHDINYNIAAGNTFLVTNLEIGLDQRRAQHHPFCSFLAYIYKGFIKINFV